MAAKCQIMVGYPHTSMSLLLSNWVERRAAKERNLRNAIDLWKKAQEAIAEACHSLNHHYPDVATLRRIKQDNNLVLLTITPVPSSVFHTCDAPRTEVVAVEFEAEKPGITVTVAHRRIREFLIEADSDHAFITLQGRELPLDEFSRLTLEETFFTPPQLRYLMEDQEW
jgi:hypothetical protein